MAYSFQTFSVLEVLTATKMNQVEVNIRDHAHGAASVAKAGHTFTSPVIETSITTASTTFTAFAGATTLLTIGGTGASAVFAIPGTLNASGTTGALTVAGGAYIAKALNVVGAITATSASPQLTLGVLNTTSGGIKFFGSTSGNVTLAPNVAAGASVTVTLPATSVTLNAAGDLTGTTLAAAVVASSLTSVGALNGGSITSGFGAIDVGADAISGGAISGTTGVFSSNITVTALSSTTLATFKGRASDNAGAILFKSNDGNTTYGEIDSGSSEFDFGSIAAIPVKLYAGNSGTAQIQLATSGIVTMPTYGAGTATFSAAGVISSVSDERLKIKDGAIKDPISMLLKLEPGYFYGKPEANMGQDRQLGFYAQNVNKAIGEEAAPTPKERVSKRRDGTDEAITPHWGFYERSVLAVAIEAAKNHEARLLALEQQRR